MGQITLLTGPERRRRWNEEERRQILEEAFSPGACVTQVAQRHDVSTALIYTWRRKLCEHVPDPCLTEAVVVDEDVGHPLEHRPAIVVELVTGGRVSIFAGATPTLVTAVVKALR
ncbi:MAG: transposase [Mesorhizobium sp.]|uniref:IS66-like element accessory protein TnpA n=1 Tax=Mesorhizobium sp. INR15 TaxID=2654248 RepID=UPI0018967E5C|nr:transposase [Mesorhizobium sp. INR15]QPC95974.1 transposase [Mesorhizobium sp. INR15]QPC95977.1 transposase [Mesorhizobium sp. INR15]